MNRSILIVICDFLLVSLLAFSTVDINKTTDVTSSRAMTLANPSNTNRIGGREDLGDVMRLALEEERKQQETLSLQLSNVQATAARQQSLLARREQEYAAAQEQLRARGQESAQLREQQETLRRQMMAAQSNIANLNQQLRQTAMESLLTKEERAAQEAEARKQAEKAALLQAQLAALQKSNQTVLAEREQLASQLQLSQAGQRAAAAQLALAEQDLQAQRQQNVKLAEGVQALASKSSELTQEIRANRSLAPNTIFNEFSTNRLTATFEGIRPGFFGGDTTKQKATQTILVTDGTNIFALCHVQDTLLSLWDPNSQWKEISATLSRDSVSTPIPSLAFYLIDPRVVLLPVTKEWARNSGCKVYHLSPDPYKFQDAVVIGAREGYYGESQFQIDLSAPHYLRMDRNTLKGWFGKFNPSTGDLVLSKNGDLLGVMVNNTYCLVIRQYEAGATIPCGESFPGQFIANTLYSLYPAVSGLPYKLQ